MRVWVNLLTFYRRSFSVPTLVVRIVGAVIVLTVGLLAAQRTSVLSYAFGGIFLVPGCRCPCTPTTLILLVLILLCALDTAFHSSIGCSSHVGSLIIVGRDAVRIGAWLLVSLKGSLIR